MRSAELATTGTGHLPVAPRSKRLRKNGRRFGAIAVSVGADIDPDDYFAEATLMDLDDLEYNTRDGLHIASLAGAWIVAVAGFGRMRDHDGALSFTPLLPEGLTRLSFSRCFRDRRLKVEVKHPTRPAIRCWRDRRRRSSITARRSPLPHQAVSCAIPKLAAGEAPSQPFGRRPARRRPAG